MAGTLTDFVSGAASHFDAATRSHSSTVKLYHAISRMSAVMELQQSYSELRGTVAAASKAQVQELLYLRQVAAQKAYLSSSLDSDAFPFPPPRYSATYWSYPQGNPSLSAQHVCTCVSTGRTCLTASSTPVTEPHTQLSSAPGSFHVVLVCFRGNWLALRKILARQPPTVSLHRRRGRS